MKWNRYILTWDAVKRVWVARRALGRATVEKQVLYAGHYCLVEHGGGTVYFSRLEDVDGVLVATGSPRTLEATAFVWLPDCYPLEVYPRDIIP